jgi:Spy/CpxP family protein refolding chaperone
MNARSLIQASLLSLAFSAAVFAQHEHHAASSKDSASTSALTAEAITQLLAGDGMGLARPAELHGYPGPKHVLELKDALGITAEQAGRLEAIRQKMLEAARPLGRAIVDAERALDAAFSGGQISESDLAARTAAIAELQGRLRRVHLQAHLETKPLLSQEQVAKYTELRRANH